MGYIEIQNDEGDFVPFGTVEEILPTHAGANGACPDFGSHLDPCPTRCASGTCVAVRNEAALDERDDYFADDSPAPRPPAPSDEFRCETRRALTEAKSLPDFKRRMAKAREAETARLRSEFGGAK